MKSRPQADNGVNTQALLAAREVFSGAPEGGIFNWRAVCTWEHGTHSRSEVNGFWGLGDEQSRRTGFTFDADHPEVFAADDKGATPTEILLVALGSCLTAGVAAVAQHRGIQLHKVVATIEGEMDLRGILGVESAARNGFSSISVHYDIEAEAGPDDIKSLVAQSQKRSAVLDALLNPTSVRVTVNERVGSDPVAEG